MLAKMHSGTEAVSDATIEMLLPGVRTRRLGDLLEQILDLPVPAGQVSQIAKRLDGQVRTFQNHRLQDRYVYLFLDGIHLKSRSTRRLFQLPRRARRRIVPTVYGVTTEGFDELIEFQIA